MEKFKDLPQHATVFIKGVLVTKTSYMTARRVFGFNEIQVDPDDEFEALKSVNVTGKNGSSVKLKY